MVAELLRIARVAGDDELFQLALEELSDSPNQPDPLFEPERSGARARIRRARLTIMARELGLLQ